MPTPLNIRFPVGGLDERWPYEQQPPFTSPDCMNVRPDSGIAGRERGGSRPGLGRMWYGQMGSGNPVRMLAQIELPVGTTSRAVGDRFEGLQLGGQWSALLGASNVDLPTVTNREFATALPGETVGAVLDAQSNWNTTAAYAVRMLVVPYQGEYHGTYTLYARMDNTTPDALEDGVAVTLTMTGTTNGASWTITEYVGGTPSVLDSGSFSASGPGLDYARPAWLEIRITPNTHATADTIQGFFGAQGAFSTALNLATPERASSHRVGFGLSCTTSSGRCLVDEFVLRYKQTIIQPHSKSLLIGSANGSMFRERDEGYLETLSSITVSLANDRNIQAVSWGGKLYIADNRTYFVGDDGKIDAAAAGANKELTATGVSDWTIAGILANAAVIEITNATGTAVNGQYIFTTTGTPVTSSRLLTDIDMAAGSASKNCSYRVERSPKVFNPVGPTMGHWLATAGTVPLGCDKIAVWRDRIVLARDNVWWMSRQGNPLDWDFAADETDVQRAVAGTASDAGQMGENITAIISHSNDTLVFGCSASLWAMRGDPLQGGRFENLSRGIGVVDKAAWCHGPENQLVFLSQDGIYALGPEAGGFPQSLSREKMPADLINVDRSRTSVLMAYDIDDRGIHIYLSGEKAQYRRHWWFDWETKSFWPVQFENTSHEPSAILEYTTMAQSGDNGVILGCRDGYLRRFRAINETDDGYEISSHVMIGPFYLGNSPFKAGVWNRLQASLTEECGPARWDLYVGETHEDAVLGSSMSNGTWLSGTNYAVHPRVRGVSAVLKISNSNEYRCWSVERILAMFEDAGMHLKL